MGKKWLAHLIAQWVISFSCTQNVVWGWKTGIWLWFESASLLGRRHYWSSVLLCDRSELFFYTEGRWGWWHHMYCRPLTCWGGLEKRERQFVCTFSLYLDIWTYPSYAVLAEEEAVKQRQVRLGQTHWVHYAHLIKSESVHKYNVFLI